MCLPSVHKMDSFEGTRVVAIMSTFGCGGRGLVIKLGSALIVSCLSVKLLYYVGNYTVGRYS